MEAAQRAFPSWSEVSVLSRQRVMFNLQHSIRDKMSELARIITTEQGKTLADAEGDVLRGLREWVGLFQWVWWWVGLCQWVQQTPPLCRGGGARLFCDQSEPWRHPQLPLCGLGHLLLPCATRGVCGSDPVSTSKAGLGAGPTCAVCPPAGRGWGGSHLCCVPPPAGRGWGGSHLCCVPLCRAGLGAGPTCAVCPPAGRGWGGSHLCCVPLCRAGLGWVPLVLCAPPCRAGLGAGPTCAVCPSAGQGWGRVPLVLCAPLQGRAGAGPTCAVCPSAGSTSQL